MLDAPDAIRGIVDRDGRFATADSVSHVAESNEIRSVARRAARGQEDGHVEVRVAGPGEGEFPGVGAEFRRFGIRGDNVNAGRFDDLIRHVLIDFYLAVVTD